MARPGLTTHRKFRRLATALGSKTIARGSLELMWETCYESGDDVLGTAEDIEHLLEWRGEAGVLARALAGAGAPEGASGFIEPIAEGSLVFRVHDLWHHAPDYVKKRRERELARQCRTAPNGAERQTLDAEQRRTADTDRHSAPNGTAWPPSLDKQTGVACTPSPAPSPAPAPSHGGGRGLGAGVMAGDLPRDHRQHAHCGRVCVPSFLHGEFVRRIGGDDSDAAVRQFYRDVLERIPDSQPIGDEPVKFWRGQFQARFGSQAPSPPGKTSGNRAAAEAFLGRPS
jgi:hypothetical protein